MTHDAGTSPDWALVRRLFDEAVALPPAMRAGFVDGLAVDEAVRGEVRSLLTHHVDDTAADTLLRPPVAGPGREGERFGAWEIVRPLGAGGMGEVFLARRADGTFEGVAAIKVLKRGMDSAAVLERFHRERLALGRLDHPHIARILDAGMSPDGLPYFVMEHVAGVPIDDAARALSLEGRLRLFLQLADAVAHAHRNLVAHRDLKPGNVLVTPQGEVKLLDFGIAKALEPAEPGAGADTTAGGDRAFTPSYASPEQVRGERVGTATDIYSLGFLLYVMLTGVRPIGRTASTAAEAARAVLEEDPTRPSSLPDAVVDDPEWTTTRRRLAGDLDNILLRALAKPVERRYASVDALADDVRRFMSGHPVSAHADSTWYVAGKFVRRHRVPVAAAALALLALVTGLGAATWQAHQAALARDEAQRRLGDIRDITRDLVGRFGDAVTYLPGGMKLKEDLLKQTLASLDRIARSADRDPALLSQVAITYARLAELQGNDQQLSLWQPEAAQANADKSIALAREILPARRADWQLAHWAARAHDIRAKLLRAGGKPGEGLREIDAAAEVLDGVELSGLDALAKASVPAEQAGLLIMRAQLTEQLARKDQAPATDALAAFDRASAVLARLERQQALLDELDKGGRPEEPKGYAQILQLQSVVHGGKSRIHYRLKDLAPALAEAREAVRYARAATAFDPQATLWKDSLAVESDNLAVVLLARSDFVESAAVSAAAIEAATALLPPDGAGRWRLGLPKMQVTQGRALAGAGRCAEAAATFTAAAARAEAVLRTASADREKAEATQVRDDALAQARTCKPA